jgi:putative nucleotidyltransferase with HDIG domain
MTALVDKVKQIYKRAYELLFDGRDLWQQLLNIAVLIAIAGAFISAIISIALGNSPVAIAAFLLTTVFAILCLIMTLRQKDVIYAAVLFSVVANFILFPIMYFTSGGYHGGMPLWLLLSLVISWVVIRRNRILYAVYGLGLLFQCGCILYSEKHPEAVTMFSSEHAEAMDVIQSLVLVSLIFGIITKYKNIAYEKKQRELDEANAVLQQSNQRITMQAMYTLAKTIDAKDRYTNGHSMRVAKYSEMLAGRMGLSEDEVSEIRQMAMLHDIGKIGVPDEIINKKSTLSEDEYDVIKGHPLTGFNILAEMPEMNNIGTGARWHHERYDGTGYPDGLKGEEIPVSARIICVADAYDAMTSNRSYRKYIPQKIVKQELENGRGSQFDPKIADIMLEIMEEDPGYELREH